MKLGLFLSMYYPDTKKPYHEVLQETIEQCQYAEQLGYEAILIPEHHFINYITNPSSLSLAIHIANHTKKIRLITAVVVMPWYHPLSLAEELALVDHVSNGRIELGVARGANKYEFDRMGVDIRNSREMMDESVDILLKALTTEDLSYEGKYYQFKDATTMPRPLQDPHPPIWISAQSPQGLRNAAKRGFNILTSPLYGCFSSKEDFEYTMNEYHQALKETGMPKKELGLLRRVYIGEDKESAEAELEHLLKHWGMYMAFYENGSLDFRVDKADVPVIGGAVEPAKVEIPIDRLEERYDDPIITDVDGAREKLKYYESIGVTMIAANMAFGISHEKVMGSLERLSRLIPELQKDTVNAGAESTSL